MSVPQVHATVESFRRALQQERVAGWTVGFVPTMGYLHDGHASLMRAAAQDCDLVAASIFVNPLQFAADEDLGDYPRDLDRDLALAEASGVTHVLVPSVDEMYPTPILTQVTVAEITARFEGAARPEHFAGVATVVAKLLSITGPCRAYFGEKDFQQLAVVRRMASDLSMPVEVVGCPVVREADGLAMSSRNVYLSPPQRRAAPVLHRSLQASVAAVAAGERSVAAVEAIVADAVAADPEAQLDYAALVDAATLEPASGVAGVQRLLAVARFGPTRLLDNIAIEA